ncbi:MAG TPA: hypothetical protein VFM93_05150 [Candidatus Limnocylindria bacterium]|nr:hypothetical protein [Candidatus Limnocylindria bacterium]
MTLFDHHIHSDRSDGSVSLAERARSVAVRPHGVSDHFPWRDRMKHDDDVLRYLDDAASLGLRVGIEYDLGVAPPLRASTRASLHYVIGAIHQVHVDGVRIGYDVAGAFLKGKLGAGVAYPERERFSDAALARRILDLTLEAVRQGIDEVGIDILGHPTFTPLQALGEPESSYPVEWQERLIAMCVEAGVAIEVNEAYGVPHVAFLTRARRAGARFAVGSDSHGELLALERTERAIAEAGLARERFVDARAGRIRGAQAGGGASTRSS